MTAHPNISKSAFGQLPDGRQTSLYTLSNASGMLVKITDFGGIITQIHVPDRAGRLADVTHGFDSVLPYLGESEYFGALIGRYGNRIAKAQFELDGKLIELNVNNGSNHLHGGENGFHRVLWKATPFTLANSVGLKLSYLSPDGEQGYPGNLSVTVIYELGGDNTLAIRFHATTDRATPVNLTNHAYFNLAGEGDILAHTIMIPASRYTPIDAVQIPTGLLPAVEGTPFDFRQPRAIGARIAEDHEQLRNGFGYDHNFVLDKPAPGERSLAARVHEPVSGRVLEVFTDEPGLQFYSGNFLDGRLSGKGRVYGYRGGICLEPQHFPDSPNRAGFPSTILRPGQEYSSSMAYRFSVAR
ncbi:galactose mutarotase [Oxalobacteraceae bacterium]|nr:galactose mutarotase [Oxalobacteraceae bacterium]